MIASMFFKVFIVIVYVLVYCSADLGDSCFKDGYSGVCTQIEKCPAAIQGLKRGQAPKICFFIGTNPVVCCVDTNQTPISTSTTTRATTTTTERYIPTQEVFVSRYGDDGCEMLGPDITSPKTGQKAWDKCIEYQQRLVYPCEKTVGLTAALGRVNNCHHTVDELIVGGQDAALAEFPHMVLLGYGSDVDSVEWLCGGSIISERFVLTAGHCVYSSRIKGPATFVVIRVLNRTDIDPSKMYRVRRIIKHPGYKPPSKYNDIALLETEPMELDQYAVPGCLDMGNEIYSEKAIATGWGLLYVMGEVANTLQKVNLTKFTDLECTQNFKKERLLKRGVDASSQVCYGDRKSIGDACQGDSGGPLQVKSQKISCMYIIVGITSFGKSCGIMGKPGLYTKVSNYVPWIESIVWP